MLLYVSGNIIKLAIAAQEHRLDFATCAGLYSSALYCGFGRFLAEIIIYFCTVVHLVPPLPLSEVMQDLQSTDPTQETGVFHRYAYDTGPAWQPELYIVQGREYIHLA